MTEALNIVTQVLNMVPEVLNKVPQASTIAEVVPVSMTRI
jgi:hypothetical protein